MTTAVTPIQYPLVNGAGFSYSSIEVKLNGLIFRGFKSVNFGYKRDRAKVYGNSPEPLFKTVGKSDYTADGELYFAEFNNFLTQLGPGSGDVFFTMFVTFQQQNFPAVQVQISGCTLDEITASFADGTDPLTMKFTLDPLSILWNGQPFTGFPLTSPPQ